MHAPYFFVRLISHLKEIQLGNILKFKKNWQENYKKKKKRKKTTTKNKKLKQKSVKL